MIDPKDAADYFAALESDQEYALTCLSRNYYEKLAALARRRFRDFPRRVADEYAVANSVLESFHRRAVRGDFAEVRDPAALLLVLSQLTRDRVVDEVRRHSAQKRGEGRTRGHSIFTAGGEQEKTGDFDRFAGTQETPSARETHADEIQSLLELLPDATLQTILLLRLDGLANEDISEHLELSIATIERKRRRIRELLADVFPDHAKSL